MLNFAIDLIYTQLLSIVLSISNVSIIKLEKNLPGIEVGARSGLTSSSIEAGATTVYHTFFYHHFFIRDFDYKTKNN